MTDQSSFEVYLSISKEKFVIYLLNKEILKNIYKDELYLEHFTDQIDYNLLSSFLDKNIFKIEKLIGNFLKSINIIIKNNHILDFSIGIKKKNYGDTINKKYLESSLTELKDLFKENYQHNKIMHFTLKRYSVDGVNYTKFEEEIVGNYMCVEVNFISIPNILIKEISNVLVKYQIKIDRFLEKKYIKNFFKEDSLDLSIIAFKIQTGQNHSEISLVSKNPKKKGLFEKFFQLFS